MQLQSGTLKQAQLKVGSMGLMVFAGPQLMESCIYQTMESCEAVDVPGGTSLLTVHLGGMGKKKKKLQFRSGESKAIADLMRLH